MKRPTALTQLLEELRSEAIESNVAVSRTSEALLYPNEDTDDDDALRLTGPECQLLFASEDNVDRLKEALGNPRSASLCLIDLTLEPDTLDILERKFTAVDEM